MCFLPGRTIQTTRHFVKVQSLSMFWKNELICAMNHTNGLMVAKVSDSNDTCPSAMLSTSSARSTIPMSTSWTPSRASSTEYVPRSSLGFLYDLSLMFLGT